MGGSTALKTNKVTNSLGILFTNTECLVTLRKKVLLKGCSVTPVMSETLSNR